MPHLLRLPFAVVIAASFHSAPSPAQTIGSGNVAAIEPPTIAHPPLTPCVEKLVQGATFGANAVDFPYSPPNLTSGGPSCTAGPWSKVVLAIDLSLDAGRQYDRTGTLWVGGVNLWFGTTAEPSGNVAPSWHIERDVTDDTEILYTPTEGNMQVANYTNAADTSVITASAELRFYPATRAYPAPRTPDAIVPFPNTADSTATLNTGSDTVSRTFMPGTFTNVERAVFDVTLQGQSDDEFWYTCVPDSLAGTLESCGGGAFREALVTIDGTPAGTAPVYPAIFTGGIDPYLWSPTPGVTTLDLKPFRMELTPFAGLLNSDSSHTISLAVAGAHNYFSVIGNLYLYFDRQAKPGDNSGSLLTDTLAAADPAVTTTQNTSSAGTLTATVDTTSNHAYRIAGSLHTSHGEVTTTVDQSSDFSNEQSFSIASDHYVQDIRQNTLTTQTVTTADATGTHTRTGTFVYPLIVDVSETGTTSFNQTTRVSQGLLIAAAEDGQVLPSSLLAEGIRTQDTVPFIYDAATGTYSLGANSNMASAAAYAAAGHDGCAVRALRSQGNLLRDFVQVEDCAAVGLVESEALKLLDR